MQSIPYIVIILIYDFHLVDCEGLVKFSQIRCTLQGVNDFWLSEYQHCNRQNMV